MRLFRLSVCLFLALGALILAWLIPAHLRAIDAKSIEAAGSNTPSLIDAGLMLVNSERIGPAWMLAQAAKTLNLAGTDKLSSAVEAYAQTNPELLRWGGADPYLDQLFPEQLRSPSLKPRPFVEFLMNQKTRETLLGFLLNSRRPGVRELLETGGLTNTALFPPVNSPAGHALDASILIAALLSQEDRLLAPLRDEIEGMAAQANRTGNLRRLEPVYLDLLSLGKRLNWIQLNEIVRFVPDSATLHNLAGLARTFEDRIPLLYASVQLSQSPREVVNYLKQYGQTGFNDLSFSLRFGAGGLRELLTKQERIHNPNFRDRIASIPPFENVFRLFVTLSRELPSGGIILKYLLLLLGGFLLARSAKYWGEPPTSIDKYLEVRGMATSRQVLFALALLVFSIIFGEPYLAQASQAVDFPTVRVTLPMAGQGIRATLTNKVTPMIDQLTIVALLMFLVIQGLIYALGLVKLAEIRRQPIPSQLKLKLLENEETFFDAGLYVGLGGTVASLVFLVMGVIKPSLMAAYSSTLFGIIFVAVLKIFHVRPFRKRLILECELQPPMPAQLTAHE